MGHILPLVLGLMYSLKRFVLFIAISTQSSNLLSEFLQEGQTDNNQPAKAGIGMQESIADHMLTMTG
jgi:hypothetical protein